MRPGGFWAQAVIRPHPLPQEQRRGGDPNPGPMDPSGPLSLLPLLLSASLRASVPSPRSDSWLPSPALGSLLFTTLHPVTSSSMIKFTLSEGHGRASRSS